MSHELPKAYDPSVIEERWAAYWVREHLFDVPTPEDTDGGTKKFTMLLPPPNVTGRLHMGHMLNQTEMDILTRWHRMLGEVSLWVPGTDHAGIATQMMVERQLASEGTNRQELGRAAFVERVWKWKCLYGGAILDQMKRLGASVDWSREYFTMDDRLSVAVKEAFVRLHEQGLIYRGAYIVNWDPSAQTAVSDLEVEHEERVGKIYHIRYPLADGSGSIVIATTRPETMLGDTAVAVNPTDERYLAVQGKLVRLPLSGVNGGPDREIPILADDWAKPEFGTGAVKVTPAHDPNDFAIGQRHDLPNVAILDETAHVLLPGSPYHGLDRYEARERIVADLEALGLLVAVKEHTLSIGLSQRTGVVIEPRLSQQWFVKIQPLADKAIEAVDKGYIKFTPDQYRKTYDEWMRNIHDWCISRQLWWGHRIPAWHCASCAKITVARDTPEECEYCGSASITQETDVLDTWFSSGLLPFTVFGWPHQTPDLAAFYPTDLLVTGFDILFFWVARMIMLGCHFMLDVPMPDGSPRTLAEAVPFREVYIHALVRDADRQKMSKTKGNVIDPIDIVQRFGTDAVRFTLASMASPGTDIAFSEARTEGYRAFANKIWNAARFLFMNIDRAQEAGYKVSMRDSGVVPELPAETPLETRWIMARLSAVCGEVDRALAAYRFDEAANAIYQFFWGEFCDWYLELVKLRLEFGEATPKNEVTAITLASLVGVFESALRLLSPFMPFLTEEIWHALYDNAVPAKSIALTRYPQAGDFPADAASVSAMTTLQELIVTVRALRKELGVPEKEAAPILLHADNRVIALADANADMLARMARVQSVAFSGEPLTGANARSTAGFDVAVLYERQIDVAAERERLTKDLAKFERGLAAADKQLNNEAFMAKAPAHIVEGLRKQYAETKLLYDKTRAALDDLPPE
ncbi:valyl-tRNA synthetase [Edaphobacter aggregans]|uniref:Valine--tRNA ligase n=1 Tax=Edaphobacter aggregans TaxID=570835 RepID=A0A3R9QCB3_9BACT|nr:valine--tRNA ligase [Edaphobacter aggregans]RSL17799.1 valyl-tRNA synthetase [Edaphobacter aggregans]